MLKRPHVAVSPDHRLFVRDQGFEGLAFWRLDVDHGVDAALVSRLVSGAVAGLGFDSRGDLLTLSRNGELNSWDVSALSNVSKDELAAVDAVDSGPVEPASEPGTEDTAGSPVADPHPGYEPQSRYTIQLPVRRIVVSAFSNDRRFAAVGDEAGNIVLIDLSGAEPVVARREAHADQVVALAFAPDGARFASSGRDRRVRVWSTAIESLQPDAEPEDRADEQADDQAGAGETEPPSEPVLGFAKHLELRGMEGWGMALAFDSTGSRLAAGAMDNGVYLFDLRPDAGELTAAHFVHSGWVADVEWSPNDAVIMTASWDTAVGLFDGETLAPQLAFESHRDYVVDLTFVPDTPFALSTSYDRTAVVWNWTTREAVARLQGHSDWVDFALPVGGRVITVCSDGTNKLWDAQSWTLERALGMSLSAGIEVGTAVDLSKYVDTSDLASRALDVERPDVVQPMARTRDMRSTAIGSGSGQTAMSLLESALVDAPEIDSFMASAAVPSAPELDAAASFAPSLPEVNLPEPRALPAPSNLEGDDAAVRAEDALDSTLDSAPEPEYDAAAAFEAFDVNPAKLEIPELDIATPSIDLPEPSIEPEAVPDEPEMASPEPVERPSSPADDSLPSVAEPDVSDVSLDSQQVETPQAAQSAEPGAVVLPDIDISADPAALVPDDPAREAEEGEEAEEANPSSTAPDSDSGATTAEADREPGDTDSPSDPSTLEMSPAMLEELDDLGDTASSAMRSSVDLDPYDDIEEERSPTMDGGPSAGLPDLPDVDEAWGDFDLLDIEEGGVGPIEPAVDMTGRHEAVSTTPDASDQDDSAEEVSAAAVSAEDDIAEVETAEADRAAAQIPGRPDDYSTLPGRPPVGDVGDDSSASMSAPATQSDDVDTFEPKFVDASESENGESDSEADSGLGAASNTLGYHEEPAAEGAFARPSGTSPRSTQQLYGIPEPRRSPSDGPETKPEDVQLSEDSTFDFFFGQQSEVSIDEDSEADAEDATSRLVPDRHFSGDFGKSPEVFDTSVSEIWAARPEVSDAKMGIVKKPNGGREFRAAFAIRTYHQWVYSVAISADGQSIASCGGNNLVCVWSKTGDLLHQLRAPSSGFNEVKFSPDGTIVMAAGDDGRIHMWMLPLEEYGRIRHAVLEGHSAVVTSIAFTSDSRYMLSGSFDGTARVWDMADGRCRVVLEDHDGPVADVAIAGRRAYTVGHDGTVRIWDDRKWLAVDVFDGFDKLLGVSSNGVVHAWTAANGDAFFADDGRPRGLLQHRGEARGVCVTESGMVVTAGQDAQIRVYRRGESDPMQSLLAPASLWSLDVHEGVLAVGGDDGKIHIYRS